MLHRKTKPRYLKKAGFYLAELMGLLFLLATGYMWIVILFAIAGPGGSL